jgi:hypothetical protein
MAVGGQAGGEKYIVQGIFFKFALDLFGIYGGDEYAMYRPTLTHARPANDRGQV